MERTWLQPGSSRRRRWGAPTALPRRWLRARCVAEARRRRGASGVQPSKGAAQRRCSGRSEAWREARARRRARRHAASAACRERGGARAAGQGLRHATASAQATSNAGGAHLKARRAMAQLSLRVVDERVLAFVAPVRARCGGRSFSAPRSLLPFVRPPTPQALAVPPAAPQPTPERASAPLLPEPATPAPAAQLAAGVASAELVTPAAAVLLPPGAAAALGCATDVATSLRAERAALLAQLQSSESRRVQRASNAFSPRAQQRSPAGPRLTQAHLQSRGYAADGTAGGRAQRALPRRGAPRPAPLLGPSPYIS